MRPHVQLRDLLHSLVEGAPTLVEPWPVDAWLATAPLPPPPSDRWAVGEALPSETGAIADAVAEFAHRRPTRLHAWLSWLGEIDALGHRAGEARESVLRERTQRVEAARVYAAALPSSYAEQARGRLPDLDGEDFEAAIATIASLGERACAEARDRLEEAGQIAKRIDQAAIGLSEPDRSALRDEAAAAVRGAQLPGLAALERLTTEKVRAARVTRERAAALAGRIAGVLGDGGVDDAAVHAAIDLAGRGDLVGALAALKGGAPERGIEHGGASGAPPVRPLVRPPPVVDPPPAPFGSVATSLRLLDVLVSVDSLEARNRLTKQRLVARGKEVAGADPGDARERVLRATTPADGIAQALSLLSSANPRLRSVATLSLLAWRALEEAERESTLGVVEHALDILRLVATVQPLHEGWALLGLGLLGFEPQTRGALPGVPLAGRVQDCLEKLAGGGLGHAWSAMLGSASRDTAIAERLVLSDLRPFAPLVARGLFDAASNQSEPRTYVLEDVARGLQLAYEQGDHITAVGLLAELGILDGAPPSAVEEVRHLLPGVRQTRPPAAKGPEWFQQAADRLRQAPRKGQAAAAAPHVAIPKSVAGHGGFYATPGAEALELALYVSNPRPSGNATRVPAICTELMILAVRNPRVVARDVIISAGTLWQDEQYIVPLRVELDENIDLTAPSFQVRYQVRWCDAATGAVLTDDRSLNVPIAREPARPVRDYSHADGRPLVLRDEELKLSSQSVRSNLSTIRDGLQQGSLAALLTGRRRRGKTSILETVKCDDGVKRRYLVVWDAREDLPFRTAREAITHLGGLLDKIPRRLGLADVASLAERMQAANAGWNEIQTWLEDLTDRVADPVCVLLLVDEFQKWISDIDSEGVGRVLGIFRGLFNRPSGGLLSFSVILSGLTNLDGLANRSADFKNAFRSLKLRPFNQRETDALIRSNESIEFDTRAISSVRKLSGGNPFLVNLLGSMIAAALRDAGRSYCLPEDVERVVENELRDEQSRVRSFVQYLLRKGEENHAAEVEELPTLVALAWVLREHRGAQRLASVERILEELRREKIEVDEHILREHLATAVENELLVSEGSRYGFATEWLERWLRIMYERPTPITAARNTELVLNRYLIRREIAVGGQAQVYEAEDTRVRQKVILKVYPRPNGVSSLARTEAEALSRVNHSGVVRCSDVGLDEQKGDVVVLELLQGRTLRQYLQSRPPSARQLLGREGDLRVQTQFIASLARALAECHRVEVVHKDVKPENIIVREMDGSYQPVLIDFGISNVGVIPADNRSIGIYTPGYVAPERYVGEGRRASSDVYSLGVVAYELCAGEPPFPCHVNDAEGAQREGRFVPLAEARPDVPVKLSELIAAMLAGDPLTRPDAIAVAHELPLALDPADWKELALLGDRAHDETDIQRALETYEKAVFLAPRDARASEGYAAMLGRFLEIVGLAESAVKVTLLPRLAQLVADVTLNGPGRDTETGGVALKALVEQAILLGAPDDPTKMARREVVGTIASLLLDHAPHAAAAPAVQEFLRKIADPVCWERRTDLFLVASRLVAAGFLSPQLVVMACIVASRLARMAGEDITQSQNWLRRAARSGAGKGQEYVEELQEVEGQIRKTATPVRLPPDADAQASADEVVGDDEKGHLQIRRIRDWAQRLLDLYRWVEAVKRVRKDGDLPPHSTRLLDLQNIAQHLAAAKNVDRVRIIPAVLDGSHSLPQGCPLRINIILPKGTTEAQRAAAMDALRADRSLFPDSGSA